MIKIDVGRRDSWCKKHIAPWAFSIIKSSRMVCFFCPWFQGYIDY